MNRLALNLIATLAVVAAVAGAIWLYGHHQYRLGVEAEAGRWQARENQELLAANSEILTLTRAARDREARYAVDLAAISASYQEDLQHVTAEKNRVISDLRAGTLRLRIPVTAAAPGAACGGAAGEAATAAGGRDGETRAELSPRAAEFLVGLATRADEIVHQLTRCQQVVMEDRR